MRNIILMGAGSGERMGSVIPKQFIKFFGKLEISGIYKYGHKKTSEIMSEICFYDKLA